MDFSTPVKLNVGSGYRHMIAKKLGFINVDILPPPPNPNGDFLYLQNDITTLESVPDNSVEEIHAYHVIEHISLPDVEKTLIRWKQVLKPGGLVVIEAPDIVKCCVNVLQALTTKNTQLYYELGLVGIFGMPLEGEESTYMLHRWGWEPNTMCQTLKNAGFVNVHEQKPKTHKKDLRDFRVVAFKPVETGDLTKTIDKIRKETEQSRNEQPSN